MCVHPDYRRLGIAGKLVSMAEDALKKEGIQKVFGLVLQHIKKKDMTLSISNIFCPNSCGESVFPSKERKEPKCIREWIWFRI